MAFTGASLADGQVATTWGSVYTPSGAKALIVTATFHNTNAATQTLEVRITRSGQTARVTYRCELLQNETLEYLVDGERVSLSDGDALEAQTTTATAVDFTITGATE